MAPEPWSEPYRNICANADGLRFLAPMIMQLAMKKQQLSVKFISTVSFIFNAVSTKEEFDMDTNIVLEGGSSENLFSLCGRFLGHSDKVACSKYDEPQLAILALHVLCQGCQVFPKNIDIIGCLLHLTSIDDRACARVLRLGIAQGLPLEGDTRRVLFF